MDSSALRPHITGNSGPGANKNSQSVGWKLNQELLATVINSNSRGKLLRIEGNTYSPLQGLQAEPGNTLQLKVTALSPYIELALLDTRRIADKPGISPAIILSEKLLHQTAAQARNDAPGLLRMLQTLQTLPFASFPPATAALMAELRKRIIGPDSLVSSRTLKPALRDASLLLEGSLHPDDASDQDADLKFLLLQIVRSLGGGTTDASGKLSRPNLSNLQGLALYQSVGTAGFGAAAKLAQQVEDEFLRLFIFQKTTLDASEEYAHRWLFELPVNFQDRLRAISIRIFEQPGKRQRKATSACWAANFCLEMGNCGCLEVSLFIAGNAVTVSVACEHTETANLLVHHQNALRDKFVEFGLQLAALQCETREKSSFEKVMPFQGAPIAGSVELAAFSMEQNTRRLAPGTRIPDTLYCAMASLFGYVLDIEDNQLAFDAKPIIVDGKSQ